MTASTPPPRVCLVWHRRFVRRPRDRCSFVLSVGSPSWRIRRSRSRSHKNALLWYPLAPTRVCLRSLSSTRLRTKLRKTRWFPPHWRFPSFVLACGVEVCRLVFSSCRSVGFSSSSFGSAVGEALCVVVSLLFETFEFSLVGAVPLPNPVWQLSVPPLAGLEGQGRRSVGGGVPPGRVSHALSSASSSVYGTHPHAFVCPYFHQGGSA